MHQTANKAILLAAIVGLATLLLGMGPANRGPEQVPMLDSEAYRLPPAGTQVLDMSSALPEGYAELTSQDAGISASYEANDQEIRFETRRGPSTPLALRSGDPATPPYEIDVRFLDAQGRIFLVQYGGHGPADESWIPGALEEDFIFGPATDAEARNSFKTAEQALVALQRTQFNRAYAPEYNALIGLLPTIREMQVPALSEHTSEALVSVASSCTYKNKVEIRYKSCCAPLAQHSATIASNISSAGTTTQAWVTCNHGTCANQMSSLKGSWTSSPNRCKIPTPFPECATPYGYTCGKHVCNDDSWVQKETVIRNACPAAPTCNDCTLRLRAPSIID